MSKHRRIAVVISVMMVLTAYLCAYSAVGAKHVSAWHAMVLLKKGSRICAMIAALLAIGLACLLVKAEKTMKTIGVAVAALTAFLSLGTFLFEMLAYSAINGWPEKVVGHFLLILLLLMAIIWLVSSMIRRQIKRKET